MAAWLGNPGGHVWAIEGQCLAGLVLGAADSEEFTGVAPTPIPAIALAGSGLIAVFPLDAGRPPAHPG